VKRDTRAGSLPYIEVGERMRLSQARLVEARAHLRACRVAMAVWGLTAGYSKEWDHVYVEGLVKLTGMDERSVRRGIKACVEAGAIRWLPNRGGAEKPGPSLVGLPEPSGPSEPGSPNPPGRGSPVGVTDRAEEARAVEARLPSYGVMSSEPLDPNGSIDGDWRADGRGPRRQARAVCPIHGEATFDGRCVSCDLDESHRQWEAIREAREDA
jgi:hypothetical protein